MIAATWRKKMAAILSSRSTLIRHLCSSSNRVIDMAARDGKLKVFLVAGEVSGDSIGSRLMSALNSLSPFPVSFAGVGGALMHKEGLETLFPMEEIAVMGIWELLPHLNNIRKNLTKAAEAAFLFRPHVVVTIDSKGFSFRFQKLLKDQYGQEEKGPVQVHYVAPSFWAWKGGETRLTKLSEFLDHMFCILPFEEEVCRLNGIAATYVGHPLLEDGCTLNLKSGTSRDHAIQQNSDAFRNEHGISPGDRVITLLPGSRLQEVTRMLPIFLQTAELLRKSFADLVFIITVAANRDVESCIKRNMESSPLSAILVSGASIDKKYAAFNVSTAALCTSGSAVLELQLSRLPCVVAYRAHFLTEWLIQWKTKLKFISLPNILLNSAVLPEILFQACTPANLAKAVSKVILDEDVRGQQITAAEKVLLLLHPPCQNKNGTTVEFGASPDMSSPSMIAASTLLSLEKQH